MEKYCLFMGCKSQYCNVVNAPQIDVKIRYTPHQNSSRFFFFGKSWKTDSKFHVKIRKTQNHRNNSEKEQGERTNSFWFPDSSRNACTWEDVALAVRWQIEQGNWTESRSRPTRTQMTDFDKNIKTMQWKINYLFNKSC